MNRRTFIKKCLHGLWALPFACAVAGEKKTDPTIKRGLFIGCDNDDLREFPITVDVQRDGYVVRREYIVVGKEMEASPHV